MPNYFDLTYSYAGALPKIRLTYDSVDDFGYESVIEEDEDISEEGYRVLMGAASSGEIDYTINDACDRFFDEIDNVTSDICELDRQRDELMTRLISDPGGISDKDFDNAIRTIRWRRSIKEEIKEALEDDLGRLLGRGENTEDTEDPYGDDFEWPF